MSQEKSQPNEELDVRVWIAPDGTIYFHNITAAVIEIAYQLNPADPDIARRYALLKAYEKGVGHEPGCSPRS